MVVAHWQGSTTFELQTKFSLARAKMMHGNDGDRDHPIALSLTRPSSPK